MGIYDLGLREDEWRRLTLREFDTLVSRFNKKKEADDYQFAVLLAHIHNVHRTSKQDPVMKPEHYLKGKKPTKEELNEKILETFRALKNN